MNTKHTHESEPTPFQDLLARRLTRRDALKAGVVLTGAAALTPLAGSPAAALLTERGRRSVRFEPIAPDTGDAVVVPAGFRASVLIRWGDPLRPGLAPFDVNAQTAAGQEQRFGFNCDYIAFFPLPHHARRSRRGLLWVNHEYTEEERMFAGWTAEAATGRHRTVVGSPLR